jgi:hypothetical protein
VTSLKNQASKVEEPPLLLVTKLKISDKGLILISYIADLILIDLMVGFTFERLVWVHGKCSALDLDGYSTPGYNILRICNVGIVTLINLITVVFSLCLNVNFLQSQIWRE